MQKQAYVVFLPKIRIRKTSKIDSNERMPRTIRGVVDKNKLINWEQPEI